MYSTDLTNKYIVYKYQKPKFLAIAPRILNALCFQQQRAPISRTIAAPKIRDYHRTQAAH